MDEREADAAQLDTVDEESSAGQDRLARPVTTLTVLHAPDQTLVGARASLAGLDGGQLLSLSRLEPKFRSSEGKSALLSPRLSRKAFRMKLDRDGGVLFRRNEVKTKLIVDGVPVADELVVTKRQLERGAVLLWADSIVLLLHRAIPSNLMRDGFGFVGQSLAMGRIRSEIHRVSELDVPVLLLGATGTGKDLIARAIHDHGTRKKGPFVAVNMGAVPPALAASELFGAVKGAYTGASHNRSGYFRQAEGGTLFLDEIGEVPPDVQVHLLRALENREIQPVGSDHAVPVDARIVAATDADLEAFVAEGKFRAPLLHRLNGYEIEIPPLKDRLEDLGLLIQHLLALELDTLGQPRELPGEDSRPWLGAAIVDLLARYDWPGNIRQLKNALRQIVIHSDGAAKAMMPPALEQSIRDSLAAASAPPTADDEPEPDAATAAHVTPRPKYRDPSTVKDEELIAALTDNRWRLKPTATQLGLSRTSLYMLMDSCAQLRRASQIDRKELQSSLKESGGDLERVSETLRVSKPGLKRRMKELGLS